MTATMNVNEINHLNSFKSILELEDVNNNRTFSPTNTLHHCFNMESCLDSLPINTGTECLPKFDDIGIPVANLTTSDPDFANGYGSPGFLGLRPLESADLTLSETNTSGGGNLGVDNDSNDFAESQFQENRMKIGNHRKGNKRGLPAKNLMAERRRRQKVNDRLFLLRSVVPRISKMDRASILVDAIDYLKELLQKVNVLNLELESIVSSSALVHAAAPNFYPLASTGQPTRIEVKQGDGGTVNIHMFCDGRPGLLLSIMRTLDSLGLDVQQAVISCFNGFALDVFQAKRWNEMEEDMQTDEIKGRLLESARSHGVA